jgi:ribonuclease E
MNESNLQAEFGDSGSGEDSQERAPSGDEASAARGADADFDTFARSDATADTGAPADARTVAEFESIEPASEYKVVAREAASFAQPVPAELSAPPLGGEREAEGDRSTASESAPAPATVSSGWWTVPDTGNEPVEAAAERFSSSPEPHADERPEAVQPEPQTREPQLYEAMEREPMQAFQSQPRAQSQPQTGLDTTIAALDLQIVLANAGLELVQTDAQKQARAAYQAEIDAAVQRQSARPPRERKLLPPASSEPLVMVETARR